MQKRRTARRSVMRWDTVSCVSGSAAIMAIIATMKPIYSSAYSFETIANAATPSDPTVSPMSAPVLVMVVPNVRW